jgi:hypothetical protein
MILCGETTQVGSVVLFARRKAIRSPEAWRGVCHNTSGGGARPADSSGLSLSLQWFAMP